MSVRHLVVLFAFCPLSVLAPSQTPRPAAPVYHASLQQPPIQPAAEPAPEPNPTSQGTPPPPPLDTAPAAPVQPQAPTQPAAPVVRVTPQSPQTESAPEPEAATSRKHAAKVPGARNDDNDSPVNASVLHNTTLWHDPGTVASLDLLYGQGGKKNMPAAPFIFEAEDHSGTNPKFDIRDSAGRKWRVKLGPEARPEVVASRLLWATGYYVNDDYVMDSAEIQGIHLKRGSGMVKGGTISEARFARKPSGQKKIGTWRWKENPFQNTREFNGLRVMMALMNNWDLKDVNNAVFEDAKSGQDIFLTSDVGATFGTNGLSWTNARSKGSIDSFKDSKFIVKTTASTVSFGTPKPPTARLIETFALPEVKDYASRAGMEWIGKDVPRQDARWIGTILGQLSHQQLVDAFRAGRFPPDQIDAYVELIQSRIQELTSL